MTKKVYCLITVLCLATAGLNAQSDIDSCGESALHHVECGKLYQLPHFQSDMATSRVPDDYDLKYHRLECAIDPAVNFISGKVTTRFVPKTAGFSEMSFDLSHELAVTSVVYHGQAAIFEQTANDVLRIVFPAVIPAGALDSVAVQYEGTPPKTGFGSWNQTSHNGAPIIWTLSEPYGARDWWPCKQTLVDKPDSVDVLVTTPAAYRAASNGLLVHEIQNGGFKTYHWKTRYPIAAYLVAVAVTNYAVYSDFVPLSGGGQLEVLNYVYPESLAGAQAGTAAIVPIVRLFDSLTIQYPFAAEKYGHAQFGWGGGMEHQTMTFVVNYGYGLLAHECAHQWFGDYITCGSWMDIWLNEGFATYFEGLTRERYFSPADWYNWKLGKLLSVTSAPGGSVFCADTTSVGRIFSGRLTYNKGAYLLHMLRWKLGNEAFFNGLKSYLNDPALAYGYARTADLQQHLEQAGGQNLQTFFNQWFYGEGYPSYDVFWGPDGSKINVTIFQNTSHASVPFFEMPVPLRFSNGVQDTIVVFEHTFSGQSFSVELPYKVYSAEFDPDLWLLSRYNSVFRTTTTGNPVPQVPEVSIIPNPATGGRVNLVLTALQGTEARLWLQSPEGKTLLSRTYTLHSGKNEISIESGFLPAGVYWLNVQTTGGIRTEKVVIY